MQYWLDEGSELGLAEARLDVLVDELVDDRTLLQSRLTRAQAHGGGLTGPQVVPANECPPLPPNGRRDRCTDRFIVSAGSTLEDVRTTLAYASTESSAVPAPDSASEAKHEPRNSNERKLS